MFGDFGVKRFVIGIEICLNEVFYRFGSRFSFGEFNGADRIHHSNQGRNGIVRGQSVVREEFADQVDVPVEFDFGVRDLVAFVVNLGSPGAVRACIKEGPACHEDHKVNPYNGWVGRVGHAVNSP